MPARWQRFGAALVIAAGLHLGWTIYGASADVAALLDERDITLGRTVPLPMRAALAAAREAARQQATLSLAATALAVLMAAALVRIGLGIRRGAIGDVQRARTWGLAAMALIALWLGMRLSLVGAQARALQLLREAMPPGTALGTQVIDGVGQSLVTMPLLAAAAHLVPVVVVTIGARRLLGDTKHEAPPGGGASRSQGS